MAAPMMEAEADQLTVNNIDCVTSLQKEKVMYHQSYFCRQIPCELDLSRLDRDATPKLNNGPIE